MAVLLKHTFFKTHKITGRSYFPYWLFLSFFISLLENSMLNLIAFFFINFILCLLLFTTQWFLAFFHALLTSIIMFLSELMVLSVISHYAPDFYDERTYFRNLIILATISKLIYFLFLQIISLCTIRNKSYEMKTDKGTFLLSFIPFISGFIALTLALICMNIEMPFILDILISISAIFLLIINLLIAWFFSYIQEKNRQFLSLQLQLQKEYDTKSYFNMFLSQSEKQKILIHDIRKHLNSILLLNEQKESRQISDYINRIIESSELQDSVQVSDNKLLNSILQQYIMKCRENHIKFKADIRSGIIDFLNHEELTSIFCNLLDNSITATFNIPNSFIELSVTKQEQKSFIIISMINSLQE